MAVDVLPNGKPTNKITAIKTMVRNAATITGIQEAAAAVPGVVAIQVHVTVVAAAAAAEEPDTVNL